MHENAAVQTQETIKVSIDELLALLKDKDIKKAILDNKRKTKSNEEYYFTKVHMPEYDTYTLLLETYTQETPYYKFFIVTVDNNIEKSNGISETGFYALYSPEEENYDPLRGFDIGKFIGTLNILNLDQNVVGSGTISYGLATGIVTICNTSMAITEMTCSHSGEHGVGDTCSPPLINDAYYVQIEVLTTCFERRVFIAGATGGATGAPSPSAGTKFLNGLSPEDKAFLDANIEVRSSVLIYLESTTDSEAEADAFAHEMIDIAKYFLEEEYGVIGNDELNAIRATRETKLNGYFTAPFDANYYKLIDTYVPQDLTDQAMEDAFSIYFRMQCAILKAQHPNWPSWRVHCVAFREVAHMLLDAAGLVPGVGEIADLTNGVIYTIEGDGLNASLSFASTIPITGWFSTGAKYANKVVNISSTTKTTLKWIVTSDGVIHFGNNEYCRKQLRAVLKITDSNKQAHHIIPWAKSSHPAVQKAAKSNNEFHMNEALNGIPLQNTIHNGSHGNYDARVVARLNAIPGSATPDEAYDAIMDIISDIRAAIQAYPNTKINDLIF